MTRIKWENGENIDMPKRQPRNSEIELIFPIKKNPIRGVET